MPGVVALPEIYLMTLLRNRWVFFFFFVRRRISKPFIYNMVAGVPKKNVSDFGSGRDVLK